eukprot:scaffold51153_cov51-Cyclotella_meneghiniana.AAC.4
MYKITLRPLDSYRKALPAGGVFQTEPPGGCLRQALDSERVVDCKFERNAIEGTLRIASLALDWIYGKVPRAAYCEGTAKVLRFI